MSHPMTIEENIGQASYKDVVYALQIQGTPDFVRRFVVGAEPPLGPTEAFEALRARLLIERLLVLLEEDHAKKGLTAADQEGTVSV